MGIQGLPIVKRTGIALAALLSILWLAPLASADVTPQDVEEARQKLREVAAALEGQVALYEAAVVREVELANRLEGLITDLTGGERALVLAKREARERIAGMYMAAGAGGTGALVAIDDLGRIPTMFAYLESVRETDVDVVNRLEAARRDYEQRRGMVDLALAEQAVVRTEMELLLNGIYEDLGAADAEYRSVVDEWERQEAARIAREEEERRRQEFLATSTTTTTTTIAPSTTTTAAGTTTTVGGGSTTTTDPGSTTTTTNPGGTTTTTVASNPPSRRVCPVDGATTFRDSWGEPRPGGRGHSGVDMMAPTGTRLVAIESGVIYSPSWHSAGGLGLYVLGDSGDTWYYAHLNGYVNGLTAGMRVDAGQRIGFVGSSGNASVPHLHLGWQPGAGAYKNPYSVVKVLCG